MVSGLLSVLSVTACGFACGVLTLAYFPADPTPFVPPQRPAKPALAMASAERDLPQEWADVFGMLPAPEPEPEPERQPEVVEELPPEENYTYLLTGLVAGSAGEAWAMISENDEAFVVRVGDVLLGGETVTAIDAKGVWIDFDGIAQLIPVHKSNHDDLVWRDEADISATLGPSTVAPEAQVSLESLELDYLKSAFQAGGELAPRIAGAGLDIVRLRQGTVLSQIGLQVGDTILRVNGNELRTNDIMTGVTRADIERGFLDLEIMRDGTLQVLKVSFDQS